MKKTRSDSRIGILPKARQAQIAEYAAGHSLAETVSWLRADGVVTSNASLSLWLSSYGLQQRFTAANAQAEDFKSWLAKSMPELSETELDRRAALLFQFEAVKTGDPKTFLAFTAERNKTRLKERQMTIDERRVALLEKKAAQLDQVEKVSESSMTPEEQRQRIREIFGRA